MLCRALQIIKEHGVTAVHPGYGFLSENEAFCEGVGEAGAVWLGPTAETMHDFSLKHVARQIAGDAGVSHGNGGGDDGSCGAGARGCDVGWGSQRSLKVALLQGSSASWHIWGDSRGATLRPAVLWLSGPSRGMPWSADRSPPRTALTHSPGPGPCVPPPARRSPS